MGEFLKSAVIAVLLVPVALGAVRLLAWAEFKTVETYTTGVNDYDRARNLEARGYWEYKHKFDR